MFLRCNDFIHPHSRSKLYNTNIIFIPYSIQETQTTIRCELDCRLPANGFDGVIAKQDPEKSASHQFVLYVNRAEPLGQKNFKETANFDLFFKIIQENSRATTTTTTKRAKPSWIQHFLFFENISIQFINQRMLTYVIWEFSLE